MAPIDIVQAQAEVATNESSVIVAEAAIKARAGQPARADPRPGDARFLERRASSRRDAPSFDARAIDLDAAVRNALDKRSDLRSAKNALEQSDINIKYYCEPDQARRQRAASATSRGRRRRRAS